MQFYADLANIFFPYDPADPTFSHRSDILLIVRHGIQDQKKSVFYFAYFRT